MKLFVTCPAGLEELLQNELAQFGIADAKQTVTGVMCEATIEQAYTVCMWSRLANRVLLVLVNTKTGDSEHLYSAVSSVDWGEHIGEGERIRVDFAGQNEAIRHTLYGARVCKDAIVDQFVGQGLERPDVDLQNPDHRINVRLTPKSLYVSLDLSGESLHKRNYRIAKGSAPIKENLAAALLLRAKWPELAAKGADFVDPMCGSGTFLIEAAMMAADIAPGILREEYGFLRWLKHDKNIWAKVVENTQQRMLAGVEKLQSRFYGCELSENIADQASRNIKQANLDAFCDVHVGRLSDSDLQAKKLETGEAKTVGLILVNPPYGMRLGEEESLTESYQALASECKQRFSGWRMGILSSNRTLLAETRLRYEKKYRIYNGPIECEFRTYSLTQPASKSNGDKRPGSPEFSKPAVASLPEGAIMVANRLKKNIKKLKPWVSKNNLSCYRVYDADLPEYSAAIDVYGNDLHIQEYQAPKSIDPHKAQRRFDELVRAAKHVFSSGSPDVFIKTRKRNKGTDQYQKYTELNHDEFKLVREGSVELLVNLESYLDTGLFLDHRPLRLRIFDEAKGKSFLNLFSYTSSATVHAIAGGASESTSVDMSNTYVSWSRLNFEKNNIKSDRHEVIRADVNDWLTKCRRGYDLIMLDPPSFSNSKKMDASFDIQRDHSRLIKRCMELLNSGGTLYFSNNLRSFRLDSELETLFSIQDITDDTIDMDFQRNKKIHSCYRIQSL